MANAEQRKFAKVMKQRKRRKAYEARKRMGATRRGRRIISLGNIGKKKVEAKKQGQKKQGFFSRFFRKPTV